MKIQKTMQAYGNLWTLITISENQTNTEQQGVKHGFQVHGVCTCLVIHQKVKKDNRKSFASCETSTETNENRRNSTRHPHRNKQWNSNGNATELENLIFVSRFLELAYRLQGSGERNCKPCKCLVKNRRHRQPILFPPHRLFIVAPYFSFKS